MKHALFIVNRLSGSAGAADLSAVQEVLAAAGLAVEHIVQLPDDECPDRAAIETLGVEAVIALSGDGTVASLCAELSNWPGGLLVLPGGTMNLLSRRLHGDLPLSDLLGKLQNSALVATQMPVVRLGEREVLTGLTVGPSTRWGEVREGMRQGDVASLAQAVPEAWSETLSDNGVWVEGHQRHAYAGIFVEPSSEQEISVTAFRANNIGDMLGHGVAWLRHDFRDGPKDALGLMATVKIVGDNPETGLLVDGEYEDGQLPVICSAGMSSVRFYRIE